MSLCLVCPWETTQCKSCKADPGGPWGALDQPLHCTEGETKARADAQTRRGGKSRLRAKTLRWLTAGLRPGLVVGSGKWQWPQGHADRSKAACALWKLSVAQRHPLWHLPPRPSRAIITTDASQCRRELRQPIRSGTCGQNKSPAWVRTGRRSLREMASRQVGAVE